MFSKNRSTAKAFHVARTWQFARDENEESRDGITIRRARATSLERAVTLQPTPSGYFNLAVACQKSGDIEGAKRNLRLYLDNSSGESEVNKRKARAELERLEKR